MSVNRSASLTEAEAAVCRELAVAVDQSGGTVASHQLRTDVKHWCRDALPEMAERVDELYREVFIDGALVVERSGGAVLSDAGRVRLAIGITSSHLAHVLSEMVSATAIWAARPAVGPRTVGDTLPATPPRTSADETVVRCAEYAAFTHQRALTELLGSAPDLTNTDLVRARRQLGLPTDATLSTMTGSLIDRHWVNELNRAVAHVGRRGLPPRQPPQPGPGLPSRVAWMTGRVLAAWERAATVTLLQGVAQEMRLVAAQACASSDILLNGLGAPAADWSDLTDPFKHWNDDWHWWPRDL